MASWRLKLKVKVCAWAAVIVMAVAKSTIEPCPQDNNTKGASSAGACSAVVGYTLPSDLKISEIATRFAVDVVALLGANAIDVAHSADAGNRILSRRSFVRVPVWCSCADGIRRVTTVSYRVRASDSLNSISTSVFSGLVSADQLRDANGLPDAEPSVDVGQLLSVPLPCTCFNSSDNGLPSLYLSYVVEPSDSLPSLASRYGTTLTDLMTVNALANPAVKAGDIISIPLPACSLSVSKYSSDNGMVVANGSYTITANHCVQCICGPGSSNMYCEPAPIAASCSSMQCKGSNLMLGNVTAQPTAAGCNVTTCSYNGFVNGTILTSLQNSLQPRCPAPYVIPNFTIPSSSSFVAPAPSPMPISKSPPQQRALSPASALLPAGFAPANGPTGSISFAPTIRANNNVFIFFVIFGLTTCIALFEFGK